MKMQDKKTLETAIDGAFKHGVSDTYELTNGMSFYVSFDGVNTHTLKISTEFGSEPIVIKSVETFMRFIA